MAKFRKLVYYLVFFCAFIFSAMQIWKYANDFTKPVIIWAGPIAGALALLFACLKINDIMSENEGTEKMKELSKTIYKGAMTFLRREYFIMFLFLLVISSLLYIKISLEVMVCFIVGAIASAIAGYIGMTVSTKANARAAHAAETSLNGAFKICYSGGLVMGMCVVGLAIIAIPVLYWFYKDPDILAGFGLGASMVALFARVGGGIFTKAADIGADLVGKVEEGIPEDDPRNPAVIADNVGDNVGDVAGMGADLFESLASSVIAAMSLGVVTLNLIGAFLPLTLVAAGTMCAMVASFFVRTREKGSPMMALQLGTVIGIVLFAIVSWFLSNAFMEGYTGITYSIWIGILAGCLIGFITQYYTSSAFPPVKSIAKATVTGAATTVISGVKTGMLSTFLPLVVICVASMMSFLVIGGMESYNSGIYGVALSSVAMLSTVSLIIAVDAYGPIADNAGGIAQMTGMGEEVRKRTDKLDAAGNTTAAIGKGFAIGSAALTAICLLAAYAMAVNLEEVDVLNPFVMLSILFGASLPFLFCGLSMGAVGRAAEKMVAEVRRQFCDIAGVKEGTTPPDYEKCVKISAKSAILEMLIPGVVAIGAPLVVGFGVAHMFGKTLGAQSLCGMLIGAISSGVCLAIMMANSGGAWDNAKKLIEEGSFGGKGSSSHRCAVIGDTVGDPLKDTSGPSLNILIKLMSIVALVCASLFVA